MVGVPGVGADGRPARGELAHQRQHRQVGAGLAEASRLSAASRPWRSWAASGRRSTASATCASSAGSSPGAGSGELGGGQGDGRLGRQPHGVLQRGQRQGRARLGLHRVLLQLGGGVLELHEVDVGDLAGVGPVELVGLGGGLVEELADGAQGGLEGAGVERQVVVAAHLQGHLLPGQLELPALHLGALAGGLLAGLEPAEGVDRLHQQPLEAQVGAPAAGSRAPPSR